MSARLKSKDVRLNVRLKSKDNVKWRRKDKRRLQSRLDLNSLKLRV